MYNYRNTKSKLNYKKKNKFCNVVYIKYLMYVYSKQLK